jgi:hypothetical protein
MMSRLDQLAELIKRFRRWAVGYGIGTAMQTP